ncbi:MAG: transporter substrate-binding domain-containing protein [Proteobacteria bacterium]|nr:transporter substrate-binding domain-containing protein [Pseudomonadota bacterium]
MRRKLTQLLSAALALLFVGGFIGQAVAQDARANLASGSVVEEIKKRGALKVGMATFVPWAMRDKSGNLIGYEIDVAKQLAEDMGVKIELVPTAWDGIIPALIAGNFDMIIGGMTITPARNLTVNFTAPYANSGVHIAANKKLAAGFTKLEDFNKADVTVVVRRGSSAAVSAQRFLPKATVRQFDDDAQAIQELLNGRAHALVATTPRPAFAVDNNPDTLFLPIAEPFQPQADAMAIRKGDPDALNFLNNWILQRTNDGWLKQRHDYWFKSQAAWKDLVAAK